MVAATVFFLMESTAVAYEWKTSLNVGALVTLVAAVHYFYMREFWITIGTSPILYRYIDWSITVPLQMVAPLGAAWGNLLVLTDQLSFVHFGLVPSALELHTLQLCQRR